MGKTRRYNREILIKLIIHFGLSNIIKNIIIQI